MTTWRILFVSPLSILFLYTPLCFFLAAYLPRVLSARGRTIAAFGMLLVLGGSMGFVGSIPYVGLYLLLGPFLFNPFFVGLIAPRKPIVFGLLTNAVTVLSAFGFLVWHSHSIRWANGIKLLGGWDVMATLPLLGAALSLVSTVPITLTRRKQQKSSVQE